MKKSLFLLLTCFLAVSAMAQRTQPVVDSELTAYSSQQVLSMVLAKEKLNYEKVPSSFWESAEIGLDSAEKYQERLMIIKKIAGIEYDTNRTNAAAMYNYGILLAVAAKEDPALFDQAIEMLQKAAQNTDDLDPYLVMDRMLQYKIFSLGILNPYFTDEMIIDIYKQYPEYAKMRLDVQRKLVAQGAGDPEAAWLICRALGYGDEAQKYKQMMLKEQHGRRVAQQAIVKEVEATLARK